MEKLTRTGFEMLSDLLGEKLATVQTARKARIWNEGRRMRLCREHTFSGGASPSPTEVDILS